MTTFFLTHDMQCGRQLVPPATDLSMFLMSPQATASCGQTQNVGDAVIPSVGGAFLPGSNGLAGAEDPFHSQLYPSDITAAAAPIPSSQQQIQFIQPHQTRYPFFQDGYPQSMVTMVNPQSLCTPSGHTSPFPMAPVPASALSPSLVPIAGAPGFQYIPNPIQFQTAHHMCGPFDQSQEGQQHQESSFACAKRQRDENYRYSLGCISKRVRHWLDKSKPFAAAAQDALEDSLIRDALRSDSKFGTFDENFYELFDESRRKRFYSLLPADSARVSVSQSESSVSATGLMTPTCIAGFNLHGAALPEVYSAFPGSSEDLRMPVPVSCIDEQDPLTKYPDSISSICPTAGIKVQYDELTDRSVLRSWRCRTDDADLLAKRGRKRFFKRVAVIPPDNWQPNKRPQPWEWAPIGPFALHIGEYVSISGTNGYPYEIVLIRHIQPALRCFLSLVPAPREVALKALNGEVVCPERGFIAHLPFDSVTHKWILNGIKPKEYTRELALSYINKDIEAERAQKEERKARKNQVLSPAKLSVLSSVALLPYSALASTSDDSCIQSSGEFPGCVETTSAIPTVTIDSLLQQKETV